MTAITAPTGAVPAVGPKSSPVTDTWYLTGRKLHALARQPVVIAFGVVQPAIWLFLFGELFRKVIDIPGFGYHGSYLAYLVPGIVAMNAMSNNMWAGMTLIEEIDRGTLNRLLVTPASRLAIMNASVAEQAVGTIVQTLIIVGLAMAGGARYPGGVAGVAIVTVAAVLVGILWGALSNMTGMLLRSREAIIGVYTFFMLPLMFLSSAFMQPDFMPGWMQAIASRNPLNWEVQVGRSALSAAPDWAGIAERCGGLLALAILAVIISVTTFRSYAKNALSSPGHEPAPQARQLAQPPFVESGSPEGPAGTARALRISVTLLPGVVTRRAPLMASPGCLWSLRRGCRWSANGVLGAAVLPWARR